MGWGMASEGEPTSIADAALAQAPSATGLTRGLWSEPGFSKVLDQQPISDKSGLLG